MKQKGIAWMMLVVQAIVFSCAKISLFVYLYEHDFFNSLVVTMFTSYILPILANVALVYFLWRPYVVTFFDVTKPAKDRALLIGISVGIVAMVIV